MLNLRTFIYIYISALLVLTKVIHDTDDGVDGDHSIYFLGKKPGVYDIVITNENIDQTYQTLKNYLLKVCMSHYILVHLIIIEHFFHDLDHFQIFMFFFFV